MPCSKLTEIPRVAGKAGRLKLRLSGEEMTYLYGDDAKEVARRLRSTKRSKRKGKFTRRMEQVQSALENFVPEVKPGNQTALNTRAAPFAAYVAAMHRSIHRLWGFGLLRELDRKSFNDPMNNRELVTKLEIAIDSLGNVDKVTVIRASGLLAFDVAAIDTVYTGGPYPNPPRSIFSADGKVYLHWRFHRDERQCGTFGVDVFILDNKSTKRVASKTGAPRTSQTKGRSPSGTVYPEEPPFDRTDHRHADPEHRNVNPRESAAQTAAERWFAALWRGRLDAVLNQSQLPFKTQTGALLRSRSALRQQLEILTNEGLGDLTKVEVFSADRFEKRLGTLPKAFRSGRVQRFAVARFGKDTLTLVLERLGKTWKVAGLIR